MSDESQNSAEFVDDAADSGRSLNLVDDSFLGRPAGARFHRLQAEQDGDGKADALRFVTRDPNLSPRDCTDVFLVDQIQRSGKVGELPAEAYCRILRKRFSERFEDFEWELVAHELYLSLDSDSEDRTSKVDEFCDRFPEFRRRLEDHFEHTGIELTGPLDQTGRDAHSQTVTVAPTQPIIDATRRSDPEATTLEFDDGDQSSLTMEAESFHHDPASLLSQAGPFARLPPVLVKRIEDVMQSVEFQSGDYLTRQGEPGDGLFVIGKGQVEIHVTDEQGEKQRIDESGPGEILGEMALLTEEPRTADLIAATDVEVRFLPISVFDALAAEFPVISRVLTELLADRLGRKGRDALSGKTLDLYRIQRRLGKGGMAIVYQAEEVETGRRVALKMMSHRLVYDVEALRLFQREAQIIESFDHPNIVRMIGRFRAFRSFFIAMEFCDGVTLDRVVREQGKLSVDRFRKIFSQLASALAYAHGRDVMHRDIKPANVMLTSHLTVKLMDFGLANPVHAKGFDRKNAVAGTPRYMAPEQLLGDESDTRADLFSLGLTAYKLLTGESLIRERSFSAIRERHQSWETPTIDCECGEVADFVRTCLQIKPEDRTVDLEAVARWE